MLSLCAQVFATRNTEAIQLRITGFLSVFCLPSVKKVVSYTAEKFRDNCPEARVLSPCSSSSGWEELGAWSSRHQPEAMLRLCFSVVATPHSMHMSASYSELHMLLQKNV